MTMVCQLNEEMAPSPRQTDHLNAESRGRLSLPMAAGDFARAARYPALLLYNYTTALLTDTD